jgi:hypothetical protein
MRRTTFVVCVLLSSAALAVASPAAQADNPKCPENKFCLFEHDNFGGGKRVVADDDSDLCDDDWLGINRPVHNGASSMINNMEFSVTLRSDASTCRGDSYTALAKSEDSDFSDNHFDNEASCVQVNSDG